MKENLLQTYSIQDNKIIFKDRVNLDVYIDAIKFNIDKTSLFKLAARKNKKRGFLFVSTVLGKHIPVSPNISLLFGRLLALVYSNCILKKENLICDEIKYLTNEYGKLNVLENSCNITNDKYLLINKRLGELYKREVEDKINIDEKTLFIGFAETATGLGHSVYENFTGKISYIHTTRESLKDIDLSLDFQEEHSHATEHFLFGDISNFEKIVLIDDEFTTGNTTLNFIKEIKKKFGIEKFTLLSILDWRTEKHLSNMHEFCIENSVDITFESILKGTIEITDDSNDIKEIIEEDKKHHIEFQDFQIEKIKISHLNWNRIEVYNPDIDRKVNYLKNTGRFLLDIQKEDKDFFDYSVATIKKILEEEKILNERLLFLGTEEFIYIPMKIASYFDNAYFQSTTRSPIYQSNELSYGVKNSIEFMNPYKKNIKNFLYNLKDNFYDGVILFFEKSIEEDDVKDLISGLKAYGIKNIYIVDFD